jgi:hypothetical protein
MTKVGRGRPARRQSSVDETAQPTVCLLSHDALPRTAHRWAALRGSVKSGCPCWRRWGALSVSATSECEALAVATPKRGRSIIPKLKEGR